MSTIDAIQRDAVRPVEGVDLPGYVVRHYRGLEDVPAMADALAAANRAAGSVETRSVEAMLAQYRNLDHCDPDEDIVVVEADRTTVAYQRTWWADRNEGARGFEAVSFVHPDHAGRGIEDALLAIGVRRQEALATTMAGELGDRPAFLVRFVRGGDPADVARLEAAGFTPERRHAELCRPDFEAIPDAAPPAGIVLSRVDPTDASVLRRAWDVATEAFAESYGEHADSEVEYRHWIESPECQPGLWCVAVDTATGEVAGQILNYLAPAEADGSIVGWTESIGVRPAYRRRGIATAMLAESLRIVRDAGATRAALGVDQQNPNEAMTLYQRLGFRVTVEELELHRPLPAPERGSAR